MHMCMCMCMYMYRVLHRTYHVYSKSSDDDRDKARQTGVQTTFRR